MSTITDIRLISSLEKIYDSDKMPTKSLEGFSMLKNEKKSFQVAVQADAPCEVKFTAESEIKTLRTYRVEHIKSDLPMTDKGADSYYRFSESGYYPDLLVPAEDSLQLKKGITVLWVEIDAFGSEAGEYSVKVSVGDKAVSADVEIIDAELSFDDFVYTCWFHTDCLMSYYNFEAFSEEYWQTAESFLRCAGEYGQNCVLTPIFTPPLDTEKGKERPTVQLVDVALDGGKYSFNFDKLTRWIEMAHRCRIEYFELSHFYTQWGARSAPKIMATVDGEYKKLFGWETKADSAEYKTFLKALSVELKAYFEQRGLKDKVLIHVSDEPNISMLIPYRKASKYIHSLYPGYKIIDALSDPLFYKLKIVSNPVPANDHIHKFFGLKKDLWVYYCSAQKNHCVSNRFFCNESLRTRVIGYQMYAHGIKGFLHWGYNFYYTRLSRGLVNPYEVTDAGKEFPSGDSFIVYPAEDRTPYHSLRLKVFYDALQDMAALKTLEKYEGKHRCLEIIEKGGEYDISFRNYPHSEEWLLSTREEVNKCIKKSLNKLLDI